MEHVQWAVFSWERVVEIEILFRNALAVTTTPAGAAVSSHDGRRVFSPLEVDSLGADGHDGSEQDASEHFLSCKFF